MADPFKEMRGCFDCYLSAYYAQKGDFFFIVFKYNGQHWTFLENHKTYLMIDGKSFEVATDHRGQLNWDDGADSIVTERVFLNINREILASMLAAQKIEMQIGGAEFKIKPKFIERLHAFSDVVQKLPVQQTGK